jgi:uncharacterized membrane protein YjjP (DUF1212 family)
MVKEVELSPDNLVELRLGHLNMIQGIIGRLAGYSATVKNFSVTLAAAAVAVTSAGGHRNLLWVALAGITLLGLLDTYYLAQERAFRTRFADIAARPLAEATSLAIDRANLRPFKAAASFSVWAFYLPQLIVVWTLLRYN